MQLTNHRLPLAGPRAFNTLGGNTFRGNTLGGNTRDDNIERGDGDGDSSRFRTRLLRR